MLRVVSPAIFPTILYRKAGTSRGYNSNHSTRLMGGVKWEPLWYNNSSFFMFGV